MGMLLLLLAASAFSAVPVESWVSTQDGRQLLSPQAALNFKPSSGTTPADIPIDESKTYQRILGLGSSFEHSTCFNLSRLEPGARAEAVEKLVSPSTGIGMNLMRVCIGTPDFTGEPWYTYDDMPAGEKDEALAHFSIEKDRAYILPLLKLALEKNPELLFFASPWSPPGWMKTCDDMIGGHMDPKYYAVYAAYFVKFVEAYRAEDIPIYAVTVQNEPGVNKRDDERSWWYPSCQWSIIEDEDTWGPVPYDVMGHNERDFIRDHLGPSFAKNELRTKIWCYDHNFSNLWYPRAILSDPKAASYVEGVAFHPYAGPSSAMTALHAEFPDKDLHMTEGSVYGVRGATKIIEHLRNWACSYNAWVTMLDTNGKPNNGPFEATRTMVTIDPKEPKLEWHFDYYMCGQFMKFIQRGAIRVDSGDQGKDFAHIAFKNPDGTVVVVIANRSDAGRNAVLSWQNQRLKVKLPSQSVATYRWRAN